MNKEANIMTSTTNRGAVTALSDRMSKFCQEVSLMAKAMPEPQITDEEDDDDDEERWTAMLLTPRAMELWARLQRAGLVDEALQPTTSRAQVAVMADVMGEVLGLEVRWKPFETLWQRRNMRVDLCKALKQKQYPLMVRKTRLLLEGDKRRG